MSRKNSCPGRAQSAVTVRRLNASHATQVPSDGLDQLGMEREVAIGDSQPARDRRSGSHSGTPTTSTGWSCSRPTFPGMARPATR